MATPLFLQSKTQSVHNIEIDCSILPIKDTVSRGSAYGFQSIVSPTWVSWGFLLSVSGLIGKQTRMNGVLLVCNRDNLEILGQVCSDGMSGTGYRRQQPEAAGR